MMTEGAEDLISNFPDEILQRILCFVPTKLAIRTSLLSRRWRHVWCKIPSLSLKANRLTADSINETLARYTVPKMKSFHLIVTPIKNTPYIDTWIKFAMSRNVENLSLDFRRRYYEEYKLPDFFYNSSSFKQLNFKFTHKMVLECQYGSNWVSLQKLSLTCCSISDKSMAKILSGCPVLEHLRLFHCSKLKVLDLSRSPRLRTLEVNRNMKRQGPKQIVAPHIHRLRLLDSLTSCTLVDVASLIEANLNICYVSTKPSLEFTKPGFLQLQVKVLEMLEKLQNAEKLTFGGNFIQVLSLAESRGVYFPMLKVKSLTLDTVISQYVIPGIQRLLQNSPHLEKLTLRERTCSKYIPEHLFDQYLKSQSWNPCRSWRSKDGFNWNTSCLYVQPTHVTAFVKLVLKNTQKLDKMVLLLDERRLKFYIEDLTATLAHNNNVTIGPLPPTRQW